jgi:hypothetical protein
MTSAARDTSSRSARDALRDEIADLPERLAQEALDFVLFVKERRAEEMMPDAPTEGAEAHLMAIIQRRLPPEDQERLSLLRERNEEGQITPEEHAELLTFVDRVELADAERAEALVELARLRKVPLRMLMSALGFSSDADAE